jgi:hypothetical protein
MKNLTLLLSFLLTAGVALAAENTAPAGTTDKKAPVASAQQSKAGKPAMKNHHFTTEVVSTDVDKKEITIKSGKGENRTAPVQGKAVASLKALTPGEKIAITYREDDKGDLQAVTAIKAVKATSKKAASTKSSDTQSK